MQLSWQPALSLSKKPTKRPRAPNSKVLGRSKAAQRCLTFISEHPADWRRTDEPAPEASSPGSLPIKVGRRMRKDVRHISHASSSCWGSSLINEEQETPGRDDRSISTLDGSPIISDGEAKVGSLSSPLHRISSGNFEILMSLLPPSICYNDLRHLLKPVLSRYNSEFCKIPLTTASRANPFEYQHGLEPEPEFLIHAVMALAGHHVRSTSTQDHRHTSLQLLRKRLDSFDSTSDGRAMLDAIVILFSLDESQSTFGVWRTHLLGAYSVIEACGGLRELALSTRAGAQVAIVLWWDSIISLVSREACIFPYHYCEEIMSALDDCQWDFFGLCGCPNELAAIVFQLSRLASQKQDSSTLRYVDELISSFESWQHVLPTSSFEDEESMNQDRDRMHCSEAWRSGLLLYIYRVFHWQPGTTLSMHILIRARVIVDHVLACRDDGFISRQALLPLFFAGCELRDPSIRRKIFELCRNWDEKTRYHVFRDAVPLLEEVWARQEEEGFENVWWGSVVDAKHEAYVGEPLQIRICFG